VFSVVWLSGWFYRKSHVINPAVGAGAGYQIKVVVHYGPGTDSGEDVYCGGCCRTDFADIRFTDDNSALLNYWLQTKTDGGNAVFWVKIAASLESSAQTIYLYYGKSDASSASNQVGTFVDVVDGTVASWTLGETNASSPVYDFSGNANHGTATGTTIVSSSKYAGKTARNGNGTSDKVACANTGVGTGSFSIVGVVKQVGEIKNFGGICGQGNTGSNRHFAIYSSGTTQQPRVGTYDGTTLTGFTYGHSNLFDGNVHWFAWVVDRSAGKAYMYLDGTKDSDEWNISAYGSFLDATKAFVMFHQFSDDSTYASINLSMLSVFNVSLSGAQVAAICGSNYPDPELAADSLCIRKWATTMQPSHDTWGTMEHLAVASDAVGVTDTILRDKTLSVSDSVGANDASLGNKELRLLDVVAAADLLATLKALQIEDGVGLADTALALKGLGVVDTVKLLDAGLVPQKTLRMLDCICAAEALRIGKALQIADAVFVVEATEVGKGDRRTRLFLVFGEVAVQLTGPA
jgi:hypothetical protein